MERQSDSNTVRQGIGEQKGQCGETMVTAWSQDQSLIQGARELLSSTGEPVPVVGTAEWFVADTSEPAWAVQVRRNTKRRPRIRTGSLSSWAPISSEADWPRPPAAGLSCLQRVAPRSRSSQCQIGIPKWTRLNANVQIAPRESDHVSLRFTALSAGRFVGARSSGLAGFSSKDRQVIRPVRAWRHRTYRDRVGTIGVGRDDGPALTGCLTDTATKEGWNGHHGCLHHHRLRRRGRIRAD
jgi:hypothetical protein